MICEPRMPQTRPLSLGGLATRGGGSEPYIDELFAVMSVTAAVIDTDGTLSCEPIDHAGTIPSPKRQTGPDEPGRLSEWK